jgi:hypothetical protein
MTHCELPAWVKKGAVFAVDGGTEKIIEVTAKEIAVVTHDAFGSWPVRAFLAALASGRIIPVPAKSVGVKPPKSPRSVASSRRGRLPEVAAHLTALPISAGISRSAVTSSVLHALQGFRSGTPVRPPDIILVENLAYAGAYAEGLGPAVAFRHGRRGRIPILQPEARAAQSLLEKFLQFVSGADIEFSLSEFKTVEHFVMRGMEAFGLISPPVRPPRRGRPRGIQYEEAVRQKLSHRWRDHRRGNYSALRAIQEVAAEVALQKKQVVAAWNNEDFDTLVLSLEDADEVGKVIARIARAHYDRPKLTEDEFAGYRRGMAVLLRALRSTRN